MIEIRDGAGKEQFTGSVAEAQTCKANGCAPRKIPAYTKKICPACKGKNFSTGLFFDTLRECFLCPKPGYFLVKNPLLIVKKDYFTICLYLLRSCLRFVFAPFLGR